MPAIRPRSEEEFLQNRGGQIAAIQGCIPQGHRGVYQEIAAGGRFGPACLFFCRKPCLQRGQRALREMPATRPRSEEEFLQIGEAKLRRYGAAFLKAIEEYTKK